MTKTDYSGRTIGGKYRILTLLGKGGMGSVYLGEHIIIGKKIAIKFLHTELTAKEDMVKRFYREAQVAAAISHRNIIDVMDVGVSDEGDPYIVMEYLEGESLSDLLKRQGPMDLSSACAILEPALLALGAAHEKGIVHRDLKPENIFIVRHAGESASVKLIDLGVSKYMTQEEQSQLTQTGSFLGTPAYMAPEQIRGASDVSPSADLYSMGVIIYEILTGELPFRGTHYNELLFNVMTESPIPPKERYDKFPEKAEPLVLSLLEKEESARPASAKDTLEIVKQFEEFSDREEKLEAFMGDPVQMTIASGTLGNASDSEDGESLASDILSQMSGGAAKSDSQAHGTPTGWTNTVTTQSNRKNSLLIGGLVAAVLIVVGLVIGIFLRDSGESHGTGDLAPTTTAPVSQTNAPQAELPKIQKDEGVEIKITGHPTGAKIYYEDFLILENPFRVKRKQTVARIAVKSPGFETFRVSVIPSQDRVVSVSLSPTPEETEAPPPPANQEAETAGQKASRASEKRSRKKRSKSRKNMMIAEEFE